MGRPHKFFSQAIQNEILSRYEAGESANQIASDLGLLKRLGVKTRTRSESFMIHTVNHEAFAPPLSKLGFYFLGILASDGCVDCRVGHTPRVRLSLQSRDFHVVDGLRRYIEFSGELGHSFRMDREDSTILEVSSRIMVEHLVSYGCTSRKSLTLRMCQEAVESFDFWRGYFDGNGCLQFTSNITRAQLTTGSPHLKDQYVAYCNLLGLEPNIYTVKKKTSFGGIHGFQMVLNGPKAVKMVSTLYTNPCFSMDRKQEVANRMLLT